MTATRLQFEFSSSIERAPAEIQERARRFFVQLTEDLSEIPDDSPFWDSMQVSLLSHEEEGWSFLYRFDGRTLCVYDMRKG